MTGSATANRSKALQGLYAREPHVDWSVLLAGPRATREETADALIAAGCDADAVKRHILNADLDD